MKGSMSVFQAYADIVASAASLGAEHQKKVPLTEIY